MPDSSQMPDRSMSHRQQMDGIYSFQRHIYDVSRKHYLLGRDRLISDLAPPDNGTVLELGCGTGRNLIIAANHHKNANFFGLDISGEMLKNAGKLIKKHNMSDRLTVQQGDATNFSSTELFSVEKFDRIYISYSLSMIPNWKDTLQQAFAYLSDKGSIHIVDFGQQTGMPKLFKFVLMNWLKRFHVTPRTELFDYITEQAEIHNRNFEFKKLYKDYCQYCVVGPKRISARGTKKAA